MMSRQEAYALIGGGVLLRLVISWCSVGSNDALTWEGFAQVIDTRGLLYAYRTLPLMNHPPLMGMWGAWALQLEQVTYISFYFIFRLLPIAADLGCCLLLWKIVGARFTEHWGRIAGVAYAWCPAAVLVSAYHCNTDAVYVFFCLLAAFAIDRKKFALAGLALGAAINVKLIPVLLIPPLLACCRTRRDALVFLSCLGFYALPFLPAMVGEWEGFSAHVLRYNSTPQVWGLTLVSDTAQYLAPHVLATSLIYWLLQHAREIILLSSLAIGVAMRRSRQANAYDACALVMALFLVFAPGFGVQYVIAPLALLIAARPREGIAYGLLAGVMIGCIYALFWTGRWPAYSLFNTPFPSYTPWLGLGVWLALCAVSILLARKLAR